MFALGGCVTAIATTGTTVDVLEGNSASYPAFLNAASTCGFSAFREVGDGSGGTHYLVTFSFENKRPFTMNPASRCIINWVKGNAQTGLILSGH
jgi:hypothetical protein